MCKPIVGCGVKVPVPVPTPADMQSPPPPKACCNDLCTCHTCYATDTYVYIMLVMYTQIIGYGTNDSTWKPARAHSSKICKARPAPHPSDGGVSAEVSTFSELELQSMVRALARRPAGRSAILNSPTVVRQLTQSKRLGQHNSSSRHDCELVKVLCSSIIMFAHRSTLLAHRSHSSLTLALTLTLTLTLVVTHALMHVTYH